MSKSPFLKEEKKKKIPISNKTRKGENIIPEGGKRKKKKKKKEKKKRILIFFHTPSHDSPECGNRRVQIQRACNFTVSLLASAVSSIIDRSTASFYLAAR